jgi:hypothetical protein
METENPNIRISAASLNRICIDDKYLLILNKNRLGKGYMVYTPVGGSIKTDSYGKKYLEEELKANFEDNNDIRLSLPRDNVNRFEEWFNKRVNRETNPFRELKEELVDESGLLKSLSKEDVRFKYLGTYNMIERTDRAGQEGKHTKRYFEVYDTFFSDDKRKEVKDNIKGNDLVSLVSREEIKSQKTDDRIPIASNALPLIEQYNSGNQ